jgi:hypothetical protein
VATNKDQTGAAPARTGHSRRGLLAGAAGAVGALAVEAVAPAQPAAAVGGQPVLQGADNTGNTRRTSVFTTGNKEWASLADPNTSGKGSLGIYAHGQDRGVFADAGGSNGFGVVAFGNGTGGGVTGGGGTSNGTGVVGTGGGTGGIGVVGLGGGGSIGVNGITLGGGGDGVQGLAATGLGVHGTASAATGTGVWAENTAGGNALQVVGKAAFRRSGLLTVASGSKATVTNVPLTSASLVLATLQQHATGLYVLAAVPNVSGSSFTVYLSKTVSASTTVAWFVIN